MRSFRRAKTVTRADRAWLAGELAEIDMAVGPAERACCCPAKPRYRVVMPATAARPQRVDLLLCGHHYRVSQAALKAAGAEVYDENGVPMMLAPETRRPQRHQTAAAA